MLAGVYEYTSHPQGWIVIMEEYKYSPMFHEIALGRMYSTLGCAKSNRTPPRIEYGTRMHYYT